MELTEECGNCRFWAARDDHGFAIGGGYCRRFPPFAPSAWVLSRGTSMGGLPAEASPSGKFLNDAWPMVHQQSWCGEFQPAGREALKEQSDG